MANLYELEKEYKELLDMAEDPEVDQQAIIDTLEGLEGEISQKAVGYSKVIRQLEADAKALKEEAKHFSDRAIVAENNAKRLKEALKGAMEMMNMKEFDAGLFKLKIANNGGKKPLIIDAEIPEEFCKTVIVEDNEAIRKHLEELEVAGVECAWAHLGNRGTHLTIK